MKRNAALVFLGYEKISYNSSGGNKNEKENNKENEIFSEDLYCFDKAGSFIFFLFCHTNTHPFSKFFTPCPSLFLNAVTKELTSSIWEWHGFLLPEDNRR